MTTRFAVLTGCFLGLGSAAVRAQAPAITLDDAIERAQRVQPAVIQARGTVRNAQAQVRSATGAYLPSLTATTSGQTSFAEGPSRFNPVTNELESGNQTTKSVSFGLSSSIDLFTGFRRGADRRAATATRDAADAGLVDARYQVALATTQQFFAALAAQQLVRVREASVRRAEEQLHLSVAKLRVGSATRSDSLRSVVNLGNAQVQLASQQAAVAQTQAELGRLVGSDRPVAAADDSSFYGVLETLDTASLLLEAQARSPRVQNAEAQERAARAQLAASRSGYWPTLSLTGSANWSGTSTRDYEFFASRDLRLQLSWPLFNRFVREQTIDARYSALEAAEASAADARRQVQAALAAQFALLEAARVRIAITRTSVAAAEEDLRVVRERYRVGAATIVDVLTSQEALTQAEVDAVNARFDYLQAKAQIEALIGRKL
jgi:outer membrane protein TolC